MWIIFMLDINLNRKTISNIWWHVSFPFDVVMIMAVFSFVVPSILKAHQACESFVLMVILWVMIKGLQMVLLGLAGLATDFPDLHTRCSCLLTSTSRIVFVILYLIICVQLFASLIVINPRSSPHFPIYVIALVACCYEVMSTFFLIVFAFWTSNADSLP